MAKKRERLEVIHDILKAVMDAGNSLGPTRLLYASNLSPKMFRDYIAEMIAKGFLKEEAERFRNHRLARPLFSRANLNL